MKENLFNYHLSRGCIDSTTNHVVQSVAEILWAFLVALILITTRMVLILIDEGLFEVSKISLFVDYVQNTTQMTEKGTNSRLLISIKNWIGLQCTLL